MKKLVTAFAACMIAGLVSASVESDNIVGYQTLTPQDGLYSVGVAFRNMAATNFVVDSDQLFGYTCSDFDVVLVLNTTDLAFDTYYINGGQWYFVSNLEGSEDTPVESFTIPYGATIYLSVAGESVTIAGEVATGTTEVVFDVAENPDNLWSLVNPLPIDTTLADLDFALDFDVVLVLNTVDLAFDTYYINGGQWYFVSNLEGSEDTAVDSSTVVLPAGMGGYFVSNGEGSRTWSVTL